MAHPSASRRRSRQSWGRAEPAAGNAVTSGTGGPVVADQWTRLARLEVIGEVKELAHPWSEHRYPVPGWWLTDPDERARTAFVAATLRAFADDALSVVMARTWPPDLGQITGPARQIALDAATRAGMPAELLAIASTPDWYMGYKTPDDPPVGEVSRQVDDVVATVEGLTSFEQRAVLAAAARALGLRAWTR
jgi:hypothetical protein